MKADFTYDSDTDQFVVTLDDGTEVCRTRAPHRAIHRSLVEWLVAQINDGDMVHGRDGWLFVSTRKGGTLAYKMFLSNVEREEVQGMKLDSPLVEH